MPRYLLLLGFPLLTVRLLCQTPAVWTPELSIEVQTIGEVTPSNDGEWVAYTQTQAVIEEDSERVAHSSVSSSLGRFPAGAVDKRRREQRLAFVLT